MIKHHITTDPTIRADLAGLTTANCRPASMMFGHGFYPRRPWHDMWQYTLLGLLSQKLHLKTPDYLIFKVRRQIEGFLKEVNKDNPEQLNKDLKGFKKVWEDLEPACRQNLGMVKLLLDGDYRSRFLPKGITVGAHAILLEIFHSGCTFSVSGEFEPIPYQDMMALMTIWEPIGLCMQERVIYTQSAILRNIEQFKKFHPGETFRIIIYGAGLLPEFRTNGFSIEGVNVEIVALDMEEDNLKYLSLVYDKPISELGATYKIIDFRDFCSDPTNFGYFHLGIGMGVLSYYTQEMQNIISMLMRTLKPDGELICDLQLLCAGLGKNAYAQGWKSNLSPELTANRAIKKMTAIANSLKLKMSYKESDYKDYTGVAGINFTLQKTEQPYGHR